MSVDVSSIIPFATRINPAGLGFANFALPCIFSPLSEAPAGVGVGDRRSYTRLSDLGGDYSSGMETYAIASRWFGNIPAGRQIQVYTYDDSSPNYIDILNAARDEFFWYWTFFTDSVYADLASIPGIANWHDSNLAFFINCQTGPAAAAIRDISDDTDIASVLTAAGNRRCLTFSHSVDPYAGAALASWFASVNYEALDSTITGEYTKLTGVTAEDLSSTQITAMKGKPAAHYAVVELNGSQDVGRVINSRTHSAFGEFMDDVVNLDAMVNSLRVTAYNTIANRPNKLIGTPPGQSLLLGAIRARCEQYIANGFLGPTNYLDPSDGVEKFTRGYEILSRPEDILDLSPELSASRQAAPILIRIFRAGAIHAVDLTLDVY